MLETIAQVMFIILISPIVLVAGIISLGIICTIIGAIVYAILDITDGDIDDE